jgi:hypothetical protein
MPVVASSICITNCQYAAYMCSVNPDDGTALSVFINCIWT